MDYIIDLNVIKGGMFFYSLEFNFFLVPDPSDPEDIKTKIKKLNPVIDISLDMDQYGQIYISGFHSKFAMNPEIVKSLPDKYIQYMKGMGYTCLCWLLSRTMKAFSIVDTTKISLLASGHIPSKNMSKLIIYYATMGFSPEGYLNGQETPYDSSLLVSLKDLPDPSSVTFEEFSKLNKDNPNWSSIVNTDGMTEEVLREIFQPVLEMFYGDTKMNSTFQEIISKCYQNKLTKEKTGILCSTGIKLKKLKFFDRDTNYSAVIDNSTDSILKAFFEC